MTALTHEHAIIRAADDEDERWVTKQQLADHLQVTRRWIEQQQHLGLPRLRMTGMNRYRISEVEQWLRERYGTAAEKDLA
jgi:hypothetical protein